jgi:hypothetical protein
LTLDELQRELKALHRLRQQEEAAVKAVKSKYPEMSKRERDAAVADRLGLTVKDLRARRKAWDRALSKTGGRKVKPPPPIRVVSGGLPEQGQRR